MIPNAPSGADLLSILPQLIVAGFGMVVLLLDAIWPKTSKAMLANVCMFGLAVAGYFGWQALWKLTAPATMAGMVVNDSFTGFFVLVFCIGAILSILLSVNYLDLEAAQTGEYYALLMFTTVGAMVMAAANNLIVTFIGLEILSIALYILAGYQTDRLESDESAMKYFLLGAFASAFFLYGIALIYGATGTMEVTKIAESLTVMTEPGKNFLFLAGVAMLVVGFGFKVAVVPFHIWTPDVYEGAPTSVTAFMSVLAKAAGFAAFVRVLVVGVTDPNVQTQVSAVLASIAALTMLVGNVVAVVQTNVKRMLAYSSIAHAGYILVGLVAAIRPGISGGPSPVKGDAVGAVLFYTLAYTVSNLGAFAVLMALRKQGREVLTFKDLAGLGHQFPMLGALMTLFMLSLAGMPPFVGFFGKLFLINALVGMAQPLPWLLILFALTSVVSFYYYLGVVRAMYMDRPDEAAGEGARMVAGGYLKVGLAINAVATVVLGFWAAGGIAWAQRVAETFARGQMGALGQ